MTISSKIRTNTRIKTVISITNRKRAFFVLRNPDRVHKHDWFFHTNIAGFSIVYFSLTTMVGRDYLAMQAVN